MQLKQTNYIPDPYIEIGFVQRSWGRQGELKVEPSNPNIQRFFGLEEVVLIKAGKVIGTYHIETVRQIHNAILLKFKGIDDPEAIRKLSQSYICVHKDNSIERKNGEYFHYQLIGMRVIDQNGKIIGKLIDIMDTGPHDIYTILDEYGKETLIPAISQVIKQIDLEKNEIIIDRSILI